MEGGRLTGVLARAWGTTTLFFGTDKMTRMG